MGKFFSQLYSDAVDAARKNVINTGLSVVFLGLIGYLGQLIAPIAPKGALDKTGHLTASSTLSWMWDVGSRNAFAAVALLLLTVLVVAIAWIFARITHRVLQTFVGMFRLRALVRSVGLSGYWPHARLGDGTAPWKELQAHANSGGNQFLYILGATGYETFGTNTSPMWDVVTRFQGDIRVILMSPDSRFLHQRAEDLGVSDAQYRRDIRRTLAQIEVWRRRGHIVSHRTYDSKPNWKLIVTNDLAWVQYYRMGTHVAETPVFQFFATDGQNGLYHLFYTEFWRVWNLCGHESGDEPHPDGAG